MMHRQKKSRENNIFEDTQSGMLDLEILRQVFDQSPNPIAIANENSVILECNAAMCMLFGYTKEEMLYKKTYSFLAEETAAKLPEILKEENISNGLTRDIQCRKKTNDIFTGKVQIKLIRINGKVYKWIVLHTTPEREESTGASPPVNERIEGLTEFLPNIISEPEIVVEFDTNGKITYANKLGYEKTGYTVEDMKKSKNMIELFLPDQKDFVLKELKAVFNGEKREGTEYTIRKKDGTTFPVIASVTQIVNDGKLQGIRAVALDITEHKKIERNLIIMEKLNTLGELAGGVVHDFNNILAIVLGYTQIHPRECKNKRCKDIIHKINRTALDGIEIIKRIQNFTPSNIPREGEPVNLNDIIDDTIDLLKPRWDNEARTAGKTITFSKHLSPIPQVFASGSELREVLSNLIINSIDAIQGAGTISIRTFSRNEHVILEISDTGIGISKEVKERIFEPFFTTKKKRGTGLGMSVSFGIIKRLGGDITVQSMEGSGTTVTITLPASKEHIPTEAPDTEDKRKSQSILVIDDEENICEILQEFLSVEGHTVRTAYNGEEGLRLFEENDFSVVITDLNMPGISGWELANSIKTLSPNTVMIMLSGWRNEIETLNKKRKVVDLFLPKPIDFSRLSEFIRETDSAKVK